MSVNRASFPIPLRAPLLFAAAAALLAGCDLLGGDGSSGPLLPKPASLDPERDAFLGSEARTYVWKESLRRGSKDSLLADLSFTATRGGDTVIGGDTLLRVALIPKTHEGPPPAAALSRLGFRPARLLPDTAGIPDPGPDLPFPAMPVTGWRLDTLIGDLRFVRVLRGVETVKLPGWRYECWAFSESTWTGQQLLGSGSSWMGRWGLVRHRSEWGGYALSSGPSGTLYREITAP